MKSFKKLKIAGLLGLGLIFLADYLSERKKSTPIWHYHSNPRLKLNWDKHVRLLTNPFMKLFAGGIVSHHWDWNHIPDSKKYSHKWLKPKKDAFYGKFDQKSIGFFHHVRAHMATGVQEVCVLSLKKPKQTKSYHYAFQVKGDKMISKSRIVIPAYEKVRILISTKPLRVLALDDENKELPTIIKGPFDRSDKRFQGLRQF